MPKKKRKPVMTNQTVIDKLTDAGFITQSKLEDKSTEFSTSRGRTFLGYERTNDGWERQYQENFSYLIPYRIYTDHVAKFNCKFKLNNMVRMRDYSKRRYARGWSQETGQSGDWKHLGIGSGKQYMTETLSDALNEFNAGVSYWDRAHVSVNQQLLIGNRNYAVNILDALDKAKYFRRQGFTVKDSRGWNPRPRKISPGDFIKTVKIDGAGVFGPKQLINGWITEVYIHFLWPDWEKKREARYFVTFETGASGLFTDDYMDRVWDTDFQGDEVLMEGCIHEDRCPTGLRCEHKGIHMLQNDCHLDCAWSDTSCKPILDYRDFFNTSHGKAKDLENE